MKETVDIDNCICERAQLEAKRRSISLDDLIKQALEIFLGIDTKKI